MKTRPLLILCAVVLLPVVAVWIASGVYLVNHEYLNPPQPPYDQPSLLPGLAQLVFGCGGAAFLVIGVLYYVTRRRARPDA